MAAVKLVAAVGDQDEGAHRRQPACDVVEQVVCGVIGPMNVLDHEQQRPLGRRDREQREDRLEQAKLRLSGIAGHLDPVAELRKQLRELAAGGPEASAQMFEVGVREVVADRLDERQVRQGELGLAATAGEDRRSEPSRLADQLVGKPGLADPRFPGDDDEPAAAPPRLQQRVLERGKRLLPTNQDWGDDGAGHGLNSLSGRR
jgi:hypothetical protein